MSYTFGDTHEGQAIVKGIRARRMAAKCAAHDLGIETSSTEWVVEPDGRAVLVIRFDPTSESFSVGPEKRRKK